MVKTFSDIGLDWYWNGINWSGTGAEMVCEFASFGLGLVLDWYIDWYVSWFGLVLNKGINVW